MRCCIMLKKPNNLLEVRKSTGLSRTRAAEDLQLDPKTLYRYENGTQCPNVYVAMRLSDYYQRSVKELFPME
ncbi:MAG TPA: XRE family transcriptional regulator [Lachnospiraceae bacterium]|nr:XRE family transcriptional regulator [Lachnospiraceae bacterium]